MSESLRQSVRLYDNPIMASAHDHAETLSATTMPAARLHGPRDLRCEEVAPPGPPPPGWVTIAVGCVGICGSDLHTYEDGRIGDTAVESPLTLGHEFAGRVVAVGDPAVAGSGEALRVGDRVAVDPAWPCGRCEPCRRGHPNLCVDHAFAGVWPTPGAMQGWINAPASACFPVPESVTDEDAAMLEPLGVGLHAVDLGHVRVGVSVLVVGAGPIGLLVAQAARLAGARPVIVTDPIAERVALARQQGSEVIRVEPGGGGDAVSRITALTAGHGVDVAFEAAWSGDDAIAQAVDALKPGGRLVVVGIAGDDRLTFRHSAARRKGLTIAMCRRMKHTYPRALRLAQAGDVDLRSMITHRFSLEQAGDALDLALSRRDGAVKVMVNVAS